MRTKKQYSDYVEMSEVGFKRSLINSIKKKELKSRAVHELRDFMIDKMQWDKAAFCRDLLKFNSEKLS